jgi:hypothetical protein
MLLYHPAFDIYHGVFRMLRLLQKFPERAVESDKLRILDFYLLFPGELQGFTFPSEFRSMRKEVAVVDNPYQQINDPKRIFFRLEPYQNCALRSLAAHQFIDGKLFNQGQVLRTSKALPEALNAAVERANEESPAIISLLTGPLLNLDFYGKSGLKGRSDLFEYRYDATHSTTGA